MKTTVRRASGLAKARGFTLWELMIVVAILGILAALAYPNYQSYVLKGNRSAAKAALLDAASRMEEYFINNKTYTGDMTDLGFGSDPLYIDSNGNPVAAGSTDRLYAIGVSANTATSYTLRATAQLSQASDSGCTTLELNHLGVKSASACW